MSKSKGNVIAPQKIADTLGADILRLWVASTDYSGELSISDEILKRTVETYRRIRNTLRFLLANLADFNLAADALPPAEWVEIDRYMLAYTAALQNDLLGFYERYEFHQAVARLHHSVPKIWAGSIWIFSRIAFIPRWQMEFRGVRLRMRSIISCTVWYVCLHPC